MAIFALVVLSQLNHDLSTERGAGLIAGAVAIVLPFVARAGERFGEAPDFRVSMEFASLAVALVAVLAVVAGIVASEPEPEFTSTEKYLAGLIALLLVVYFVLAWRVSVHDEKAAAVRFATDEAAAAQLKRARYEQMWDLATAEYEIAKARHETEQVRADLAIARSRLAALQVPEPAPRRWRFPFRRRRS